MPDAAVLDQDGRKLRFHTDLIKEKTVVVSFIYTSCTAFCPMVGRTFSKLQAALGERLGRDVHLLSITTDPATDRPERLKAWGERFGAKPGWTFVTGEKREMNRLLEFLTGDPAGKGVHSPAVLIGNYDQGVWIRESAFSEPDRYLQILADIRLRELRGLPGRPPHHLLLRLRELPFVSRIEFIDQQLGSDLFGYQLCRIAPDPVRHDPVPMKIAAISLSSTPPVSLSGPPTF